MVMATKVSQATIDKIKKMGMTAALKSAKTASPEMREGLKRMYGANRLAAATKNAPSKPAAKSPDQARGAMKAPSKPAAKSADAARLSVAKASVKMPSKGPATKAGSTTSNPATAAFNKLSPYGNKTQKYVSGIPKEGLAGRKSVPGKPSVGEKINAMFSTGAGLKANNGMTAAQVAAENKRRAAAVAAAKAKKK
jgi:hypothetical protein